MFQNEETVRYAKVAQISDTESEKPQIEYRNVSRSWQRSVFYVCVVFVFLISLVLVVQSLFPEVIDIHDLKSLEPAQSESEPVHILLPNGCDPRECRRSGEDYFCHLLDGCVRLGQLHDRCEKQLNPMNMTTLLGVYPCASHFRCKPVDRDKPHGPGVCKEPDLKKRAKQRVTSESELEEIIERATNGTFLRKPKRKKKKSEGPPPAPRQPEQKISEYGIDAGCWNEVELEGQTCSVEETILVLENMSYEQCLGYCQYEQPNCTAVYYKAKEINRKCHMFSSCEILRSPSVKGRNYELQENCESNLTSIIVDPTVRKIVNYEIGGQHVQWVEIANDCIDPVNLSNFFTAFKPLVCPGSNAIDIGAQVGDTSVAIAAATFGGTTYAYEPHPKPFHTLELQSTLNPNLNLKPFNIGLMQTNKSDMWWDGVADGCNGHIVEDICVGPSRRCLPVKVEDTEAHFNKAPEEFLKKLSFIKINGESQDKNILRGLKNSVLRFVRPLIQMEWFVQFKSCNEEGKDLFLAVDEIDYIAYEHPFTGGAADNFQLQKAVCGNYSRRLLLYPKEFEIETRLELKNLKICPNETLATSAKMNL